jgi:hypothetical protein
MTKKDPERLDADNPEWTKEDMKNARPAKDVLPELLGDKAAQELLRKKKRDEVPAKPER